MNKYFLMLAAAGLIAAAPAYYAFQAHADESAPLADATPIAPTAADEAAADGAAAPAADAAAPAATEEAPAAEAAPAAGDAAPAEEHPAH